MLSAIRFQLVVLLLEALCSMPSFSKVIIDFVCEDLHSSVKDWHYF